MADNITAPATGAVLATDEIGGVHYPRTKIAFGGDGAATDVSPDAPLPVGVAFPETQPVSAQSLPLPTGAASADNQATIIDALALVLAKLIESPSTEAKQDTIIGHVDGIESALGSILAKIIAAPATEAKQDSAIAAINALGGPEYETVAASQSAQVLGATGAAGDLLTGVLVIPATTSPGIVQIKDGAGAAITVFAGGTDSISTLHPFFVPLGIRSGAGAWQITTGADVSAIGVGNFT